MELPDLGDHCALKDCARLDFLPFGCQGCGLTFCLDHREPKQHGCNAVLSVELTEDQLKKSDAETFSCTFIKAGCKKRELTAVICPKCKQTFCLTHRHPPDHECPVYREEERLKWEEEKRTVPKTAPTVALNQRPLRNAKARQMAAKVALMKMKLHAQGDESIPQTERVYFWVALPRTTYESDELIPAAQLKKKDIPTFFCERWSLGRAIDFLAAKTSLPNKNNISLARKLRFFRHEDGKQFDDLSKTWKEVVDEKMVFSGSPLVMEYVQPDDNGTADIDPKTYPL